jgi:hypothetical protein
MELIFFPETSVILEATWRCSSEDRLLKRYFRWLTCTLWCYMLISLCEMLNPLRLSIFKDHKLSNSLSVASGDAIPRVKRPDPESDLPPPSKKIKTPYPLVRKRTIPTERPPLVGEVSANFLRIEGVAWSEQRIPPAVNSVFLTGFLLHLVPRLRMQGFVF